MINISSRILSENCTTKHLCFFVTFTALSFFFCSCDNNTIKQACEDHNYEKAYEMVDDVMTSSAQSYESKKLLSEVRPNVHSGIWSTHSTY